MQLSKRLQCIADYVTVGKRTADIGCDHGWVSIYLAKHKIAPAVIAMDVGKVACSGPGNISGHMIWKIRLKPDKVTAWQL